MTGTRVYPWHLLKVPGDSFLWYTKADERSLRSQASKQAKRLSVTITVNVTESDYLLVTYVAGVP